ncbi:helix-turn-helix domain-containing protein [Amycolatopsis sp. NPDC003865]
MVPARSRHESIRFSVCELIAERRAAKGWSQDDLATRLHAMSGNDSVTREEVSRWERGKRIPGPYWRSWLSRVLDTPCAELELAATATRRRRRTGA